MNNNQHKSIYLLNLSHRTITTPLHKHYTLKLHDLNRNKVINYPDNYQNGVNICVGCGQINIPGINVSIRKRKRLVYKCLSCKHSQLVSDEIETKGNSDSNDNVNDVGVKREFNETNDETKSNESRNKKSKKKRKIHSLSKLLEEKKSPKPSLDLLQFLQ